MSSHYDRIEWLCQQAFSLLNHILATINSSKNIDNVNAMQCYSVQWCPEVESNNQFPYILCVCVRMKIEWINCGIFQRIANNTILKQSFDWLMRSRHIQTIHAEQNRLRARDRISFTHLQSGRKSQNFWFAHNGKAIFDCFIACCYRLTNGLCLRSFWFILRVFFFIPKSSLSSSKALY